MAMAKAKVMAKVKAKAMEKEKVSFPVRNHPDSIYAGAIGAALWGAFRHHKLARLGQLAA